MLSKTFIYILSKLLNIFIMSKTSFDAAAKAAMAKDAAQAAKQALLNAQKAVSYTHLTLPTKA